MIWEIQEGTAIISLLNITDNLFIINILFNIILSKYNILPEYIQAILLNVEMEII